MGNNLRTTRPYYAGGIALTGLARSAYANGFGATYRQFFRSCFAAGTPLLMAHGGSKPIEQISVGDWVLARSDADEHGEIAPRQVEEVFVRSAELLELVVSGQIIKTTMEHPFWVVDAGWRDAHELNVGDRLLSHDGRELRLDSIRDMGKYATVYNLRVAEWHTYFVGCAEWGWSVWAHNTCSGAGPNPELSSKRSAAAQSRWAKHRAARALGERETPAGRGPEHTARQKEIVESAGGKLEQDIILTNGKLRTADVIDADGRIHQVGNMRTRGGLRPSGRERGAIEDIRKKLPDATIIFHDKLGRQPSLINPDLQPNWKAAPIRERMDG